MLPARKDFAVRRDGGQAHSAAFCRAVCRAAFIALYLMFSRRTPISISSYHNLLVSVLFILTGIIVVVIMNLAMKRAALTEAREKARIILDRNLATHAYFTEELKPKVFALSDPVRSADYFEPSWMSSTYAVREIYKRFRSLNTLEYYYKECAINARSPENEADANERLFLERLNRDATLTEQSEVRMLGGRPYFVVLRRGEVMEETCLRCHTTPRKAPGGLVARYGPARSFHRKVGDVVSAVSIRIPLEVAYADANRLSFLISTLLLMLLGLLYAVQRAASRRMMFMPLERVRDKAIQIATDEKHLGDEIDAPAGKELRDLTAAFNSMSKSLLRNREHLEEQVVRRTAELRRALDSVKKLSGLLPICASCKKIRDDEGYWKQIEVYIRDHSEAQFSHGICPDCARTLYPELHIKNEG